MKSGNSSMSPRKKFFLLVRTACIEAQHALADKRHFSLPPEKWVAFLEVLDKPPVLKPELLRLFSEPSVLERP
jgi:uncharacterized protein (DUF1778 family)